MKKKKVRKNRQRTAQSMDFALSGKYRPKTEIDKKKFKRKSKYKKDLQE